MKLLNYNNEQFEAERIVKTDDGIVGYNSDVVAFKFSGISDFSAFTLAGEQDFDAPSISDKERVEQLENMLIMMMEVM